MANTLLLVFVLGTIYSRFKRIDKILSNGLCAKINELDKKVATLDMRCGERHMRLSRYMGVHTDAHHNVVDNEGDE
jgi:hypothetical protein